MQVSASLSPSLGSAAACMQKSSPHSQASGTAFACGQGRIRSSSESVWSPVYSLCSIHCKETRDKIPMFFYSGGKYSYLDTILVWGWNLLVIILNLSPMMNTLVEKLRKS
ncbi:unnamed protein product [Pipistrellus nathusii]|uniref:Uncharacterized protein n=1 Tax=Pipistrellus nathusii TaxID=59473 RepID=A0ABP0AI60_PIPNA